MAETKRAPRKSPRAANRAQVVKADAPNVAEEKAPVLYDEETVQRMIAEATARSVKEALAQQAQITPQIVRISAEQENVLFLWQAEVADDNVELFGDNGIYGRVTGKTGTFFVPKSELSRVLTDRVRRFIDNRWLMILSGLDEDERKMLGVQYREGELISREAFGKLLDMGEELLDVYPKLCESHRRMVAQRFLEAYERGDKRVTREMVTALNAESKKKNAENAADSDMRRRGDFQRIIEGMNAQDAAGE